MNAASNLCDPDAVVIIDEMLEQTRLAAFTLDFDLFSKWCALPHPITTFEKKRVIATPEELKAVFDAQCDNFAKMQVTDMIRHCISATFDGPDMINSMHITHLMSGNHRVMDPYPAFMVLTRHADGWRVSKSDYAVKAGSGFEQAIGKDPRE